jgi:hypothetical protein
VNEYLSLASSGKGKSFHVIAETAGSGSEGTIEGVRNQLEKKGMRFVSSAVTIERNVESGAFVSTVEAFAAGITGKVKTLLS